jgi:hypothetical protein
MIGNAGKFKNTGILAVVIGLVGVLCAGSVWAADVTPSPISFPGKLKAAKSPSGRYDVRIKRLADDHGAPTYRLTLQDLKQHRRQNIVTFQRSVELTWRSGAEGFSLNEYTASNFSDCVVAVPGERMKFRSLMERIAKQPDLGIAETVNNSHFYVECRGWNGADQVVPLPFSGIKTKTVATSPMI